MTPQESFLLSAFTAAKNAGHIFPEYAACEAALESNWGKSKLAIEANNLFGRKQSHDAPVYGTLDMPTKEFLHGDWITTVAHWVKYPDWNSCFVDRMNLLRRLSSLYGAALRATTGEGFVEAVSVHWSTDPQRADKVLATYHAHQAVFNQ